jgi:hypothetical protein
MSMSEYEYKISIIEKKVTNIENILLSQQREKEEARDHYKLVKGEKDNSTMRMYEERVIKAEKEISELGSSDDEYKEELREGVKNYKLKLKRYYSKK